MQNMYYYVKNYIRVLKSCEVTTKEHVVLCVTGANQQSSIFLYDYNDAIMTQKNWVK